MSDPAERPSTTRTTAGVDGPEVNPGRPTVDQLSEWSFPASDPPATWTWDVERSARGEGRPRPIVVGYDGSPASARALERAATLAGTDGRVVVVTARPSPVPTAVSREPILDGPSASGQRRLLEGSRELLERHRTNATFHAMASDPAEALAQVARMELAQLIVVGQTGSGYVTRALLGSTAQNLLRQAPCDVLVVT